MLTLTLYPLVLVAFVGITIAGASMPPAKLMPIVFALLALVVADVATRDARANTLATPARDPAAAGEFRLVEVWLGAAARSRALCGAARADRRARRRRSARCSCGIIFVAALATSLGVLTVNSKTFIVIFLSFWYLVVNDHGIHRWLDFAGFYGAATRRDDRPLRRAQSDRAGRGAAVLPGAA